VCPPHHGSAKCEPGQLKDVPAGDRIIYGEPGQCRFIVSNGQWRGENSSHRNKGERVPALCSSQTSRMLTKTFVDNEKQILVLGSRFTAVAEQVSAEGSGLIRKPMKFR